MEINIKNQVIHLLDNISIGIIYEIQSHFPIVNNKFKENEILNYICLNINSKETQGRYPNCGNVVDVNGITTEYNNGNKLENNRGHILEYNGMTFLYINGITVEFNDDGYILEYNEPEYDKDIRTF